MKFSPQFKPFFNTYILRTLKTQSLQFVLPFALMVYLNSPVWTCLLLSAYTAHNSYKSSLEWTEVFMGSDEFDGDKFVLQWFIRLENFLRFFFAAWSVYSYHVWSHA